MLSPNAGPSSSPQTPWITPHKANNTSRHTHIIPRPSLPGCPAGSSAWRVSSCPHSAAGSHSVDSSPPHLCFLAQHLQTYWASIVSFSHLSPGAPPAFFPVPLLPGLFAEYKSNCDFLIGKHSGGSHFPAEGYLRSLTDHSRPSMIPTPRQDVPLCDLFPVYLLSRVQLQRPSGKSPVPSRSHGSIGSHWTHHPGAHSRFVCFLSWSALTCPHGRHSVGF
jgi:hypothetical protein